MKSQAVLFSDVGKVHIGEVDVPDQPGPGQVLIQNVANGICQGEVHLYKGIIPPHHPYPFIGGHEPVGYVVAVGEGVDDLPRATQSLPCGRE